MFYGRIAKGEELPGRRPEIEADHGLAAFLADQTYVPRPEFGPRGIPSSPRRQPAR